MFILAQESSTDEMPEMQCGVCDTIFSVVFNRNPVYTAIEYCPFCGEEIDEFSWSEDEDAG